MLNSERDAKKLLNTLKEILKLKKKTYESLAADLGISLPTMKRWMNSTQLSIGELNRICNLLDLTLADLIAFSERNRGQVFRFTPQQELFFAENQSYLAYFFELNSGMKTGEIEKKHGISKSSTKRYLKELTRLGLLKAIDTEPVTVTNGLSVVWDDYGPLGRIFSKEMLRQLSDRMLNRYSKSDESYLALWGRSLTTEDLAELKEDFKQIEEKYRKLSDYNRKIFSKDMLAYFSCAVMVSSGDTEIFKKVREIT